MKAKIAPKLIGKSADERSEINRGDIAGSRLLFYRVSTAALFLFAVWAAFVIAYPVMGNGWMYHVKQPVPVVMELSYSLNPRVLLRFERYSMWTMQASSSRELHCDSVQQLPPQNAVIEAGDANFVTGVPFLQSALNGDEGEARCHYVGAMSYRPFGDYGPQIIYGWRSEEFSVNRELAQ